MCPIITSSVTLQFMYVMNCIVCMSGLCCLAPTFPCLFCLAPTQLTECALDTSLVLSLHPFSFAAQAPAAHGTGGEATGRHAPSLDSPPALHEPLRPLIFHRCFPSHLHLTWATASVCTCYPRAATHALFLGNRPCYGPAAAVRAADLPASLLHVWESVQLCSCAVLHVRSTHR